MKNIMATAKRKLKRLGIKTTADLDTWIKNNIRVDDQGRRYGLSRYAALKELVGEDAATWILHDLATNQCAAVAESPAGKQANFYGTAHKILADAIDMGKT
jgi:hypothetical protein